MSVDMQPVRSSNVAAAGFDSESGELLVEFRSGAVYAYAGQSEASLQDILTSNSPGGWVNRWLKGASYRRIS